MKFCRNKIKIASIPVIDYEQCPAKTFTDKNGEVVPGRTVFNHCQIVGAIAKEIIKRMPGRLGSQLFPIGAEMVAASHDIGKICPTFYNKIMRSCGRIQLRGANPEMERNWGGHAGVSQLAVKHMSAPGYIPEILGQHHGFSPNVAGMLASDEVFGGMSWQQEREKLFVALRESIGKGWPCVQSVAQARILAGLTSVADWIGSGDCFDNPEYPWKERINEALDKAGFIEAVYNQGLNFQEIFGFAPRPVQSTLIEQVTGPGVYVMEAPMGLGKTEASLYCAYKMLEIKQSSGIYFALPTQLTSNMIFDRFQSFLKKILAGDCRHRGLLLHANAWLFDTEMGEDGSPGGAWFNQRKRGLLAPFAVGTIDQALMAAMNVKHGFVRAFGLAGKVVILDEVHTYDTYTSTLLDSLVDLLRQLQCTVIILSATLNWERRQQLLNRPTRSMDYPLITAVCDREGEDVKEVPAPADENQTYQLSSCFDEGVAVEEVLKRAEQGQQVVWIENTVKEAQNRYLDLAARAKDLGVACGLLHSRFTASDRQRIEQKWVNCYGKAGWSQRQSQGRILVGTQVLEQSLDIDADFMVTRFAPTDMLLQRMGRLWRHEKTPRCKTARPELWLLVPELQQAIVSPQQTFGFSAIVYDPYVLCRSLEVWQGIRCINLPEDIRGLIENTYVSREEQEPMSRWLYELDNGNRFNRGRLALRQLARVGLSEGGTTLPESKAQTRYSETDNYEVLILKAITRNSEMATLRLLDGEEVKLPLKRYELCKLEWRKRTAKLMRQIVCVPNRDKPAAVSVDILKRYGLHHCFFLGSSDWLNDESVLRVAVVDDTDHLRGIDNNAIHDKYDLEYRDDLGYRVMKKEG